MLSWYFCYFLGRRLEVVYINIVILIARGSFGAVLFRHCAILNIIVDVALQSDKRFLLKLLK